MIISLINRYRYDDLLRITPDNFRNSTIFAKALEKYVSDIPIMSNLRIYRVSYIHELCNLSGILGFISGVTATSLVYLVCWAM
jgi:hypothetical protein